MRTFIRVIVLLKKLTNINDVKRHLNVAYIAKGGLLVVKHHDPLSPPTELIVIPREVLGGLVTALHIKLDHPTKHQLEQVREVMLTSDEL